MKLSADKKAFCASRVIQYRELANRIFSRSRFLPKEQQLELAKALLGILADSGNQD